MIIIITENAIAFATCHNIQTFNSIHIISMEIINRFTPHDKKKNINKICYQRKRCVFDICELTLNTAKY